MKLIILSLLFTFPAFAKSIKCSDVKNGKIKVNAQTEVHVFNIGKTCAFEVVTSRDSSVSKYSGLKQVATRKWSFLSSGKINVLGHYPGPTDSSSTSYKSYQLFPNEGELTLNTREDGTFSLNLVNGAEVHFNKDGSFDHDKTTDLKIKDTPIKIPEFKKSLSADAYEKLGDLRFNHPKRVKIRVHHRNKYSSLTSRSIGLETNIGTYIPLGIAVGKIPGNSISKSYTLFGKDDEKLCSKKMPANYFFNYKVRCSPIKPNSQCACKYSQDEMFRRMNTNSAIDTKINRLRFSMNTLKGDRLEKAKLELERYKAQYVEGLYSKLYFSCIIDSKDALKFVADKKISGDHREIDGVEVKPTKDIYKKLIASKKCKGLKKMDHDCIDCGVKNIINIKSIESQKKQIDNITDKIQ